MNEPDHHRPTGILQSIIPGGTSKIPPKPAPKTTEVIEIPTQLHTAFLNGIVHRAAGYELNGLLTEALWQFVEHAPAKVVAAFSRNPKNDIWAVHVAQVRQQVLAGFQALIAISSALQAFPTQIPSRE